MLIDPMLGPDAAPIAPVANKRFSQNTLDIIDQLPEIDLLLLTHDHYDHLDMASMNKLKDKTKMYWVALGMERHLEKWSINPNKVREFDWWDSGEIEGIKITFTPTRHFSGRGLRDRAKSLWGGWALITEEHRIYFSGDGGYGAHFKEVGSHLGPFDFAFMECGQYNENWHHIHMYPEESVQAALDVKAERTMAVHWAGFSLAQHSWKEPIERYTAEAQKQKLLVLTPEIGEQFNHSNFSGNRWWESFT
jgi:L-ascorbate metabolism protein UlaG (beta-lactamase superfamily)